MRIFSGIGGAAACIQSKRLWIQFLCLVIGVGSIQAGAFTHEEVRFQTSDSVTLAGTLVLSEDSLPNTVVIFISGSMPDNRDTQVGKFRPFPILADSLATHGIASLRYDDRGIGASGGDHVWQYTFNDYVQDVRGAMVFLRQHPNLDVQSIGLIGHSLGGMIAVEVAADYQDIAFIISLAGPVLSFAEIRLQFIHWLGEQQGWNSQTITESVTFEREVVQPSVRHGGDWKVIKQHFQEKHRRLYENFPNSRRQRYKDFEDYFQRTWDAATLQVGPTPFFHSVLDYNPANAWSEVTCPTLHLFGADDPMVQPTIQQTPLYYL